LDRSRSYARELLADALEALSYTGLSDTQPLQALAMMVVNRDN
jgi:farnesyl diphosphate synthase